MANVYAKGELDKLRELNVIQQKKIGARNRKMMCSLFKQNDPGL